MRFLSRPRRQSSTVAAHRGSEASSSEHTLYHQCLAFARRDHALRQAEVLAMRASLDLLQPWLPLLAEQGLVLRPESLRWLSHERAVGIDLTKHFCDASDNRKLIDALLWQGFQLEGQTELGPWYSVRMKHGELALCVQGLEVHERQLGGCQTDSFGSDHA